MNEVIARTVTVTGVASVSGRPDRATLALGVQARRSTATEAMDVAAQRAGAVIAALRDAGVTDEELRTTGINLWHDQHERTFVATNQLRVSVASDDVGAHIDVAGRAGGDEFTLDGVTFSVADPAAVVAPLRAQALADARSKATELAGAEQATVGMALAITEGGSGGHVPILKARGQMQAMTTPVEVGAESLSLSVTVTYEMS